MKLSAKLSVKHLFLCALAPLSFALASSAWGTVPQAPASTGSQETGRQQETGGAVYMRSNGQAVVRNFPDLNGAALATLSDGTIVRAFRRSQGRPVFVEVEVGGGFPAWVYGAYLQPTDAEGVLLVTGSHVNMRPLPELTSSSMPLRSKLGVGERVRLIERANKAPAFAEDWIRIQAPPSSKAWIAESSLVATDALRGAEAFAAASTPLPPARPRPASSLDASFGPRPGATSAGSDGPDVAKDAPIDGVWATRLADANRAWEAADALRAPTSAAWKDIVELYREIVEDAPVDSLAHTSATRRLADAEMRLQLESVREDLDATRQRTDEEIRQIDVFLNEKKLKRSARWGRFEERGWVEARRVGDQVRYYLTFGGETVAEVRCQSKRYDLGIFEGFEIGVVGYQVAPAVRATSNTLDEARIVDASRIEVISGSARRR